MQAIFSRLLNIQLDVYNKLTEEMILLIKLNDIQEYIDTSNSWMDIRYKIMLGEYENTIISKKAYKAIYAICKILNGCNNSIAILNNYTSTNFHTRFRWHHKNYLSILTKIRKNQIGKWIESKKLDIFINNYNEK